MSKVYDALKKAEREGHWPPRPPAIEPQDTALEVAARQKVVEDAKGDLASPPVSDGEIARLDAPNPGSTLERATKIQRASTIDRFERGPAPQPPSAERANGWLKEWWRMLTQTDLRPQNDFPALLTNEEPQSRALEKFHLLRVWFEHWATTHQKRVIMMSSALPGEGKSFVSVNLAAILAAAGYQVMLVDADLRHPSLHRAFNLVPRRGLIDFLEGRAEFASCLTKVPVLPRLTLVTSGGVTANAAELVASRAMSDFVAQARALEPQHYVLIDAPAALATPEAEILAGVVDAVLLIVAANHTPRQMVKETVELLQKVATCGVVLNRFEPLYSTSRSIYGYYGQNPKHRTSGLY